MKRTLVMGAALLGLVGCSAAPDGNQSSGGEDVGDSLDAISTGGCSTSTVLGLSKQLVAEANCIRPHSFASFAGSGIALASSAAFPYLQTAAASALRRTVAGGGTLTINSALRTLPQQYLLYTWYTRHQCGITLAATPGTSPHERGLAIDTPEYSSWRSRLESHGFRWHGAGDVVHFDYVGAGGVNLGGLSVLAFQRLWNRNHAGDRIAEDGQYGPQTAARLARAPSGGFAIGACKAATSTLEDVASMDAPFVPSAMPETGFGPLVPGPSFDAPERVEGLSGEDLEILMTEGDLEEQ